MRKVFRNGNSLAVTVPKEYAQKNKINEGSLVEWKNTDQGLILSVEKKQPTFIDPEVAQIIKRLSKKYSRVWQELSEL